MKELSITSITMSSNTWLSIAKYLSWKIWHGYDFLFDALKLYYNWGSDIELKPQAGTIAVKQYLWRGECAAEENFSLKLMNSEWVVRVDSKINH